MPLKTQKTKTAARRVPVRRAAAKAVKAAPDLSPEEVASLEDQLQRHQRSEQAWQKLLAHDEDDDRWTGVEEHLLSQSQRQDHAERRWKYFAK